jgi:lysylphosphatidylglycerol synthetase-like protein (DUF2156 family)
VRLPGSGRRRLAVAVLLCAAGAGLALFAATRVWAVEATARPGGLSDQRIVRTGTELAGWLPAVAVVGLAGAGALLATRGLARRMLGALLAALGAGLLLGAAALVGAADPARLAWPVLAAAGGAATVVGGVLAAAQGHRWPGMGARYERAGGAAGQVREADPTRAAWDALDRGEDPTVN